MANEKLSWVGPFTVEHLLRSCLDVDEPKPPESNSAYVVSTELWTGKPTPDAGILYVGSNTGASLRFRTRIGDLLADLFGFFTSTTGHHSGGYSLHCFCKAENMDPFGLHVGWAMNVDCARCLEVDLVQNLIPKLNKKRPPACAKSECRTNVPPGS